MKDKRKILYIGIVLIVIMCIAICISIIQSSKKKDNSITPKGAIIVIEDKNSQFFTYSDGYFIEVLKDDQWIKLNETEKFWNDFVYVPDENGILSMQLDWTKKYGALENNKYRIGMIIGNEQIQDNIYAEFEIN